ncbi:hypothetical protein GO755_39890 [Spirosoma sp. HMF4905]|uniref:PKD domain-containing protein n=1 Tax=Spirosoma arboris TaxID=2682092 RepID=A0A7K1SR63_9BACT|nr:hypothetical protein [Spirosoma arboris]MVM36240.1 hypothetical protein [Spirosoma arboris]
MRRLLIAFLLPILVVSCSSKEIVKPAPKADFIWENVGNGLIQFTNQSTNADVYSWQFDVYSTTTSEKNPKRQFGKGKYSVSLSVQNSVGVDGITKVIEVTL